MAERNTIALPTNSEAAKATALAIQEAGKFFNEAHRKGGYVETSQKLAQMGKGLLAHMVTISTAAVRLAGNDLKLGTEYFKLLCSAAQSSLMKQHKGADGKEFTVWSEFCEHFDFNVWNTYKSNISTTTGADERPLNPANYGKPEEFIKAMNDRKAERRAARAGGNTSGGNSSAGGSTEGPKMVAAVGQVYTSIGVELRKLTDEGQEAAMPYLLECLTKVKALLTTKEGDKLESEEDAVERKAA